MKQHGRKSFMNDVRSRQSNTIWPDTLHNGSSVDRLLWYGSSTATLVQRVGIGIFGIFFLAFTAFLVWMAHRDQSTLLFLFAIPWLYLGIRVSANAFRK